VFRDEQRHNYERSQDDKSQRTQWLPVQRGDKLFDSGKLVHWWQGTHRGPFTIQLRNAC